MGKTRWLVGGLVLLTATAATFPDLRLARELAGAKAEGLWTSAADVRRAAGTAPERETAKPLVRAAEEAGWKFDRDGRYHAGAASIRAVDGGYARPFDRTQAKALLKEMEPVLALWRTASQRPRLVPDRRYEDGFSTLYPEIAPIHGAVTRLVAAARLGMAPRENLVAAARLSSLVRREPGILTAAAGANMGMKTLRVAEALGLGKPIEATLGASPEVRFVLGPELPAFLASADYRPYMAALADMELTGHVSFTERAIHYGPLARNTKAAGIARWRALWSRLPKDGWDYDGAAKVVDEELPGLDALMPSYADVMTKLVFRPGDAGRGNFLCAAGELERERATIRAGR